MNATTTRIARKGPDAEPLLEQVDLDTLRCTLCGSTNVDVEETPSMYAGGSDFTPHCNSCGAFESTDPFTGVVTVREPVKEVICDECGKRHIAEPAHVSPTQGQIYAVVCEDGLTDYYTSEALVKEES